MPTPTFQPLGGEPTTQQIQDYIIKLIRDLNFLLGNLDTLNVNRLDAKVIIANTITALQIAANTITADKMNVTQLSAISANLGTITAGNIYGTYIATANGTYPRSEMSNTNNLFAAFTDAIHFVNITASTGSGPGINWNDGGSYNGLIAYAAGLGILVSTFGTNQQITISPTGDLNLRPNGNLTINNSTGYTGSFVAGTKTVTVTKGIITSVV